MSESSASARLAAPARLEAALEHLQGASQATAEAAYHLEQARLASERAIRLRQAGIVELGLVERQLGVTGLDNRYLVRTDGLSVRRCAGA